jgi:hypothetical protein
MEFGARTLTFFVLIFGPLFLCKEKNMILRSVKYSFVSTLIGRTGNIYARSVSSASSKMAEPNFNTTFSSMPTTIFATMTELATQLQAINLGQGFPSDALEGPPSMKEAVLDSLLNHSNQVCVAYCFSCCSFLVTEPLGQCITRNKPISGCKRPPQRQRG